MAFADRSVSQRFVPGQRGAAVTAAFQRSEPRPAADVAVPRNRVRDLTALVMLAACVFLAAALATFDPADPPLSGVFPPNARAVNACGLIGSAVAGALHEAFGLGSWFAVAMLLGLDIAVLRRRPLPDMPLRTIGAAVALAGGCTLLTLFLPDAIVRPLWGPGGRLGGMGRLLVDSYLARTGGAIVVIAATLGGLFLACDALLLSVATAVGTAVTTVAGGIAGVARRLKARRSAMPETLDAGDIAARFPGLRGRFGTAAIDDEDEDEAMDDGEPTIRVKRREITPADDAIAGVEVNDAESLPADDVAEETPTPSAAQPLVPIRSLSSRRKPQAGFQFDLVLRDHGAGLDLDHLHLEAELAERLLEHLGPVADLLLLLVEFQILGCQEEVEARQLVIGGWVGREFQCGLRLAAAGERANRHERLSRRGRERFLGDVVGWQRFRIVHFDAGDRVVSGGDLTTLHANRGLPIVHRVVLVFIITREGAEAAAQPWEPRGDVASIERLRRGRPASREATRHSRDASGSRCQRRGQRRAHRRRHSQQQGVAGQE